MIEYISFITAFNVVAVAEHKQNRPFLLLVANLAVTVAFMTIFGGAL